jgi:hypothetical protein
VLDYFAVGLALVIAFGLAPLYVRWMARRLGYRAGEYGGAPDIPSPPRTGDVLLDLARRQEQVNEERTDNNALAGRGLTRRAFVSGVAVGLAFSIAALPARDCGPISAFSTSPAAVLLLWVAPESAWVALKTDEKSELTAGRAAFRLGFLAGLAPIAFFAGIFCVV